MVDILIVGAGPTGLMAACECLRFGLTVLLIDKSPTPSIHSKALVIQARTLEIFDQIGIVDDFLNQGLKVEQFKGFSNQKQILKIDFSSIDSPYPFALSIEQNQTEALLTKHLHALGGSIQREVELISLEQTKTCVIAKLYNLQKKETLEVRANYLIGCDGPHSTVRKTCNLSFKGKTFETLFSLADVEIAWDYPKNIGLMFPSKLGMLAAVPMRGENRYRLIFELKKGDIVSSQDHGEIPPEILPLPTLDELTCIVRKKADPEALISNPRWMAHFRVNSRVASHFRKERIFLAGDAAHIHSPAGGQGMNTGLQDVYNLAWKLALVLKKGADSSLLDSYDEERHFIGEKLIHGTERLTEIALTQFPLKVFLRNLILPWVTSFSSVKRKIASLISEIAIHYPNTGRRVPDASLTYEGKKTTLFALWRKNNYYKLLIVDSKRNFTPLYQEILPDLVMRYIVFDENLLKKYADETAYLIRPDGYLLSEIPLIDYSSKRSIIERLPCSSCQSERNF